MPQPQDVPLTDDELLQFGDDPRVRPKLKSEERRRLTRLRASAPAEPPSAFSRFVEPIASMPGAALDFATTVAQGVMPTEAGATARHAVVNAVIDPSVEQLRQAVAAGREGRPLAALGHGAAAVPLIGPAVASGIEQMQAGDVAGGAGSLTATALPFVAGPLARGAATGGAAALRGTGAGEALANWADRSSVNRLVDVMAPKVGPNKLRLGGQAAKVAPALAREPNLGALTRQGLHTAVEERLAQAGEAVDEALNQIAASNKHYPTDPLVGRLIAARDKLTVRGSAASTISEGVEPQMAVLDRAIQQVQDMGPTAPFDQLRRLKQQWQQSAKAIYTPSVATDALKHQASGQGFADAAGAVQDYLVQREPSTAAPNATYTLFKRAAEVMRATEETERVRPKVGQGLLMRATGAMVGAHEGGAVGAGIGAVVGEMANRAAQMAPTFQIVIARRLAAVADALRGGDAVKADAIVQQTIRKFPRVRGSLTISGKFAPTAGRLQEMPRAAAEDRDQTEPDQ